MTDPVKHDCDDLDAIARGDDSAFGRLYDRHSAVVLALCMREAPGRTFATGEDAMQETFTRAFGMLERVVDCTGFRPWLYRVASFVCSEHRRAAARRRRHESEAARRAGERRDREETTMADDAHRREAFARLESALDRLPERERLAIHLHYLDPEPVHAAKRALGLSRSGYYKTLDRARTRLAAMLDRETTS